MSSIWHEIRMWHFSAYHCIAVIGCSHRTLVIWNHLWPTMHRKSKDGCETTRKQLSQHSRVQNCLERQTLGHLQCKVLLSLFKSIRPFNWYNFTEADIALSKTTNRPCPEDPIKSSTPGQYQTRSMNSSHWNRRQGNQLRHRCWDSSTRHQTQSMDRSHWNCRPGIQLSLRCWESINWYQTRLMDSSH